MYPYLTKSNPADLYEKMSESGDWTPLFEWEMRLRCLGIKKGEFCEMYNIIKPSFSQWLNGHVKPNFTSYMKVERALSELEDKAKGE